MGNSRTPKHSIARRRHQARIVPSNFYCLLH